MLSPARSRKGSSGFIFHLHAITHVLSGKSAIALSYGTKESTSEVHEVGQPVTLRPAERGRGKTAEINRCRTTTRPSVVPFSSNRAGQSSVPRAETSQAYHGCRAPLNPALTRSAHRATTARTQPGHDDDQQLNAQ